MNNGLTPNLAVTNQTDSPILFVSVKNDPSSALDAYAQTLTPVSSVIAAKSAQADGQGEINLDIANNQNYNLIGLRPSDLFPITNQIAVVPINCSYKSSSKCTEGITQYYQDLTIVPNDIEAMKQSLLFYQSNLAYPGTEMAIAFIKILESYKTDPLNVQSSINNFFKQTKGFEQCTLESYVAVSTYCQNYAYAWANWQSNFSYEIFEPATDPNATKGLVSVGKVIFTKKVDAPNPADINDYNGGYEISYQSNNGKRYALQLVNGNLVSQDSDATPTVSLFFSYGLKSDFTNVETDKVAWPLLAGKVEGVKVIGVGIPETSSLNKEQKSDNYQTSSQNLKNFADYFSPKTAAEWINLICRMMIFVYPLGLLIFGAYKIIRESQQSKTATGEDLDNLTTKELDAKYQKAKNELAEVFKKRLEIAGLDTTNQQGNDIFEDIDLEQEAEDQFLDQTKLAINKQKELFQSTAKESYKALQMLEEYGITDAIKKGMIRVERILDLNSKIENIETFNQYSQEIKTLIDALDINIKNTFDIAKFKINSSSKEVKQELYDQLDKVQDVMKASQNQQEETERTSEGEASFLEEVVID